MRMSVRTDWTLAGGVAWIGLALASPVAAETLTVSVMGTGTVVSSPSGIACGADAIGRCVRTFSPGTKVTVRATAPLGWTFTGWRGGACAGTRPDCRPWEDRDWSRPEAQVTAVFRRTGDCASLYGRPYVHSTGSTPRAVATGDVNRDGRTDIVVANRGSDSVSVFLGDVGGGFRPGGEYRTGAAPNSVLVGDYIGRDGIPDIVTVGSSRSLTVLRGTETDFASEIDNRGGGASALAGGDFDGDGSLDIAGAEASNFVSILLGGPGGDPYRQTYVAVGGRPISIATGDFNKDGRLDFVTANAGSNTVSVVLRTADPIRSPTDTNGPSGFAPAVDYTTGRDPSQVAVADLNGDGTLDLAIASRAEDSVWVRFGDGTGAFHDVAAYVAGDAPTGVAAADVNQDGVIDLAVSNELSSDVRVFLGTGRGGFRPALRYGVDVGPAAIAVADLDRSGGLDIVVANHANTINWLRNACSAACTRTLERDATRSLPAPSRAASGDFDNDGEPDLVVTGLLDGSNAGYVTVVPGDFVLRDTLTPLTGRPFGVATGDFNHDGRLDAVVTRYAAMSVAILLGRGDRTFTVGPMPRVGLQPTSVAVGDIDRDGHLDLAVSNYGSGNLSILLGRGDGDFRRYRDLTWSGATDVALADFNRDGWLDIVGTNIFRNQVTVRFSDGGTGWAGNDWVGFGRREENHDVGGRPEALIVADLNRDGRLDLAVANHETNDVSVLFGRPDGTFRDAVAAPAGSRPISLQAGDLNGDTWPDLVVANQETDGGTGSGISVLWGAPEAPFQRATPHSTGGRPRSVVVDDFDRDGRPDAVLTDPRLHHFELWRGTCPKPFPLSVRVSGPGRVTSEPGGIDCGSDCFNYYDHGTQIWLQATVPADASSHRVVWGGACEGHSGSRCSFNMDGPQEVTAQIVASYSLYLMVIDGSVLVRDPATGLGQVCNAPCIQDHAAGARLTLIPMPRPGWDFAGWSDDCPTDGPADGPCTVTMDGLKTVTARFAAPPVVWRDAVNVTVSGNSLTKSSPENAWDAGAASTRLLTSGDGFVEWTASDITGDRMCGLAVGDVPDTFPSYSAIDFAVRLRNDGQLFIFERGVARELGGPVAYAPGDRIRVAVSGGVVRYLKNGDVFHTSSVAPGYPMRVSAALATPVATLLDVRTSF